VTQATGEKPAARGPRRGELLEVEIDSLAFGGRGLARAEGFVVFVAGALPWGLGLMVVIPVMVASTYSGYADVFDETGEAPTPA